MAKMPTMDEWAERLGNKAINEYVYEGRTLKEWIDLIAKEKCIVFPADATNGDVIKVLFPQITVTSEDRSIIHFYVDDEDGHTDFSGCMQKYVWNAPYNGGKE